LRASRAAFAEKLKEAREEVRVSREDEAAWWARRRPLLAFGVSILRVMRGRRPRRVQTVRWWRRAMEMAGVVRSLVREDSIRCVSRGRERAAAAAREMVRISMMISDDSGEKAGKSGLVRVERSRVVRVWPGA